MDTLQISALLVKTHIGIHDWEQRILQRLLIDLTIQIDLSTCHNELEKTIDYDKLCHRVTTYLESNQFSLIETVAECLATLIKEEFKVNALTVSVSKPHAIKNAGNVSVTITR